MGPGPVVRATARPLSRRLREGPPGPSPAASFVYDGLGRRAHKTIAGTPTAFRYDGLDAVVENSGGSTATYLRTLGIDEALARTDAAETVDYLGDASGSSVALTTTGGTAATTYTYESFGRAEASGTLSPNAFQYTGRENDGTGLYYYRARHYDPGRGRFVSGDPIRSLLLLIGDANVFTYTGNNPQRRIDPFEYLGWVLN